MKTKVLIIIVAFVSLTAFNLSNTFDFNNPSIKIIGDKTEKIGAGQMVVFSVMLCSHDNLVNFSVHPNIIGVNSDSLINFDFDKNTKQASLNYYYIVPENLKKNQKIEIVFQLKDSKTKTIKNQIIQLNQ